MEEYTTGGIRSVVPEWVKSGYRNLRTWWLSRGLKLDGNFSLSAAERNASSLISVVIPVHDSPEVTRRCLQSLECFGGQSEIIIVDDGSKLESTRQLLDEICTRANWRLIRNIKPVGHSRASEAGVAVSTKPYICLLNSDTVITPWSWSGVVQTFETGPQIAVVGPSTSHTVTAQVVPQAMFCRHHWSDHQIWHFAETYVKKYGPEPVVDLPRVGGFGFFMRRNIWDQLGGFDTNLPDYGNETELCRRVLQLGWRIVWTKASYIHHLGSESYGRTMGLAEIRKRGLEADVYVQQSAKK